MGRAKPHSDPRAQPSHDSGCWAKSMLSPTPDSHGSARYKDRDSKGTNGWAQAARHRTQGLAALRMAPGPLTPGVPEWGWS